MTLLASFGTPRNLHAFMKFYEVLVWVCFGLICCMPEYASLVKSRFYVCLDTYRNEAVCLTFVLRLYYFMLELD